MKKRIGGVCFLLCIGVIGIIALDLKLWSVPTWLGLIWGGMIVAALVCYYRWKQRAGVRKFLLTLCSAAAIGLLYVGMFCNPYWNSNSMKVYTRWSKNYQDSMSYEQAKSDLEFAVNVLKKDHPAFIHSVPEKVNQAYNQALQELKETKKIDVTTVKQEVQKVLSVMGDAHTTSYDNYENNHYMKESWSRTKEREKLIQVNGVDLEQIFEQKKDLYCYEAKSWGIRQMKQDLLCLEGLYFLGIPIENGVQYTYEDTSGQRETIDCTKEDYITMEQYQESQKDTEEDEDSFVSYKIDEANSLAVLTLTSCNYNQEYCNCVKEMFTQVKEKNIQNVAVDLRKNGGGNSEVANEFLKYLPVDTYKGPTQELWRLGRFLLTDHKLSVGQNDRNTSLEFTGNLYALTSTGTFSSAMMFAEFIKDNQLGTIIGEAPGNSPSGYGDISIFLLPNSRLYVQVATKKFLRADPTCQEPLIEPDISCDSEEAMDLLYTTIQKEK